ncbi:TorF family putative porin [Methylobacillus flagellatus]|uniref:Uncharacterized protein n=1 Tax=Methylobacillus flagellatus (strain ATCC 51484 / DSM 6875 / VKM B-1610 / KT) TaxID=265072 RepID=Q1H3X1_METFK|nr:TorF family putative porin [Methylobacillus flagellatus]ABE48816.1 conserved hypothetical protein [Methylobacillus flagellatus KT]
MVRKNTLIAMSLMLGAMPYCAVAEEDKNLNEEASEEWADSPHHVTTNLGLYSDYLFRGLSLARGRGAIQGFIDYSHVSGLFLGIGGTNVHKEAINGNTLEIDLYGGYSRALAGDVIGTVGFLQFYYPDNEKIAGQSSNVTEVNLAIDYRHFNFKYSYSLTDWFGTNTASYGNTQVGRHTTGTGDSKGSNYAEFNYNDALPFWGLNLYLHVGHTTVKNYSVASYTDYAAGINKDFSVGDSKGWNAGLLYHATDANDDWYVTASGYKTGGNRFFGYVKRTF